MKLSDIWDEINYRMGKGLYIRNCQDLLAEYDGDDYLHGVRVDSKKYHRYVVYKNKEMEMVIITWAPNQQSGFHGHPGECIYRVLEGDILEELISKGGENKISIFSPGDTGYIDNSIGKHNMYSSLGAVTLHIYSPPF